MKVLTVVGARPQFVKAAMVSKAFIDHGGAQEIMLHTGQHYDPNMSEVFFTQMGIPKPTVQLNCGGGTHGVMTGKMLAEIESALIEHKPDCVMVYGDTDSTLAGALAAAKLHIPVAHVEAGLRSFNKAMPEEINRILTDHMAELLLCPTQEAIRHLSSEGVTKGVYHVGDVMYDAALMFAAFADKQSTVLKDQGLNVKSYLLCTCHRAENTDDPARLKNIFSALQYLSTPDCPVVLPLHPRTKRSLENQGFSIDSLNLKILPPISFLDMVALEKNAAAILTDSGGVQKEAYFHGVPCVTMRDETEWVETISAGWNNLVGADEERIIAAVCKLRNETSASRSVIEDYGQGDASTTIVNILKNKLGC